MPNKAKQLPILDAVPAHDPANWHYPFRAVVGNVRPKRRRGMWAPGMVLDQGSEGACVGFGWTGELLASPRRNRNPMTPAQGNKYALAAYREMQTVDEWDGEAYSGTSINAGAKVMQSRGLITEYRWCFSVDDLIDALLLEGPVVIAVPWFDGMYEAPNGMVSIGGDKVGYHCLLVTGYHPTKNGAEVFRWRNSWGLDYGINGSAWITRPDLETLLSDFGEICVPMGRQTVSI